MRHTLAFLLFVFFVTSCQNKTDQDADLAAYIPRKASVIIKTSDVERLQSDVTNNQFLQAFNETTVYKFIANQGELLKNLKPKGESLICFTKLGGKDYEVSFITKMHKELFKKDSSKVASGQLKSMDSLSTYSYIIKDDIFIASTSALLIENIKRDTKELVTKDALFENAYASASRNAVATVLIKGSEGEHLFNDLFPGAQSNDLKDTFAWTAIDINLDQNDIQSTGVLLTEKGSKSKFNLLRNTEPKENRITTIAPNALTSLAAITYRDWTAYKNNKAVFDNVDPSMYEIAQDSLFSTFDEVGKITLGKAAVIVAVSKDMTITEEALTGNNFKRTFRDIKIYDFETEDAFAKAYYPILSLPNVNSYAIVGDLFLFANDQSVLESVLVNYQNNATLDKNILFQNTAQQLSDASSYLYIENLDSGYYKTRSGNNGAAAMKNVKLDNYHFVANQLVQESDYMLLNGLITQNEDAITAGGVTQIANVKLTSNLIMPPQLVKNHRTNGMDIITQDVNNNLYLISNAGKILWQKELDGPILGEVSQVDLYRNGRLQLAFTTSKSFFVLDRNGKEVSPFPLTFSDPITQPLAVFDYDNNRKYRFVVVQDDQLLMYDKKGDAVTGFTFNKAGGTVVFPPKHIRMANKDYIVVAENSGKLNILSRTGKRRVTVKEKINFGNTPVFQNGNKFETYTVNGEKISITTSGKLTQSISEHSSDSKITITPSLKIGQRENELFINGKKNEIAYGSYAKPTVATVKNKSYISITNEESSEVYIFDNKGKLLPNFPVYGVSPISIGNLERNKTLGFVTQGSANSILIYKIN